jgi:lactoylglutathione lyase
MIRVNNLDESIEFYRKALGMHLISKTDYPDGEFTLAFMSYGESKLDPCIELTYNYGKHSYELGTAFGHIAFATDDIHSTCEKISSMGYKVVRKPGPMKHGSTIIAFLEDPNGYKIELIQH